MTAKIYLLAFFSIWALSFIPGFPGFARASDLEKVGIQIQANSEQIQEARIERIADSIFDLRVKECSPEHPIALRQQYARQRAEKMALYQHLTHARYELQDCVSVR